MERHGVSNQAETDACQDGGCSSCRSADSEPVGLTSLLRGQMGVLAEALLEAEDRAILRAMGLRPGCRLRLCRVGEPCIVAVCGCGCSSRVGMARVLAERVMVRPMLDV